MATTKCNACGTRTVGSGGKKYDTLTAAGLDLCGPCYEEAGWENAHSDHGHTAITATPEGEYPEAWGVPAAHKLAGDLAYVAEIREDMKACWICHPELNAAQKAHTPRTSKGGEAGTKAARRPQLNHRTQCLHPQTPEARRECRKAFWEAEAKATQAPAKSAAAKAEAEHLLKATTAAKVAAKVRAASKKK